MKWIKVFNQFFYVSEFTRGLFFEEVSEDEIAITLANDSGDKRRLCIVRKLKQSDLAQMFARILSAPEGNNLVDLDFLLSPNIKQD